MSNDDLTVAIVTFANKSDTDPRPWRGPWGQLRKRLTNHIVRQEKDGPLWSPTVYKKGTTRKNENVIELTMAVGDVDHGATFEEIAPKLEPYEYVAYSTFNHIPEAPRYRIVIPLTKAIPAGQWADCGSRIREHVFGQAADESTKDASRAYYTPSCPAKTKDARFAVHHPGTRLDPDTLPPASTPVARGNARASTDGTTPKVPLGKTALDFVANGAPIGEQRTRALAAARNYLSAGYSEAETIEAVWRGLQASVQDPAEPWTKDEVFSMVLDLASKPAPPLKDPGPTARPGDRQGEEKEPSAPAVVRQAVVVCLGMVTAEQVEFLWRPYIPLGKLTILEGDPGVGKSWLALALAGAVSLGAELPGATRGPRPADVLLLSAEDGLADTIVPRLEAIGADRRRIHALTGIVTDKGERGFSLVEHLDLLEEAMAQHRPVLVMLDPLVSFLGAGVDMHRANETRAVLSPLASLAERHRAAILAVRHLTKTGRDKAIYRGQGSIDFTAAARSVLLAGEESETGKRGIVHTKSSLAPKGPTLGYAIEDGRFYWTGTSDLTASRLLAPEGQDERSALGEAEDFLHEALSDGERPVTEVQKEARAAGIREMTLDRAKAHVGIRARRRGAPGKRGGGAWFWALPEDLGDRIDLECQESTVENLTPLINPERKSPLGDQGLDTLNPPEEIVMPDPWEVTP